MKQRRLTSIGATLALLVSMVGAGYTAPSAYAAVQTCTWTGAGGNNNFSTVANWSGCNGGTPLAGDVVKFDNSVVQFGYTNNKLNNDLNLDLGGVILSDASVFLSSLSLSDGAYVEGVGDGYNYLVVGTDYSNRTTLVGKGSVEFRNIDTSSLYDISGAMKLRGSMARVVPSSKAGSIDSVSGVNTIVFGDQTKDQTNLSYSIPITTAVGSMTSITFLSACSELSEFGSSVSVVCNVEQDTQYNLADAWNLQEKVDVTIQPKSTVNITGGVTGQDKINRTDGNGILNIGGAAVVNPAKTTEYKEDKSTESFEVTQSETAVMFDGSIRSSATVVSGGILKGTGTLKNGLTVYSGGVIAPGMSPGCITVDSIRLWGEYQFEIGGTEECSGYDQIKVLAENYTTGAVVAIGETAVLNTSRFNDYTPKQGEVYTIIDQAGDKAVEGTFSGLAEGAKFEQNGIVFKISYVGGDGNDVTLTVENQPTAPDTGFALVKSNPALVVVAAVLSAGVLMLLGRKLQAKK